MRQTRTSAEHHLEDAIEEWGGSGRWSEVGLELEGGLGGGWSGGNTTAEFEGLFISYGRNMTESVSKRSSVFEDPRNLCNGSGVLATL